MTRFPFGGPDFPSDEQMDAYGEDLELTEVRCRYCCERGLRWEETRGNMNRKKWVLVDEDGSIHDCRKPPKLTAFPLVEP